MDLLRLLHAVAAGPVSGERLAQDQAVGRAMVWKAINSLRAEGLDIAGGRAGYQLADPAGFGPTTLAWRCGRPVDFHPSCESTNRLAKAAARAWPGPPAAAPLVVADHQTEGRGRRGRSWLSAPGQNLLFSLVLRPPVAPADAARCVLQWAAAMAEALDLQVKWPNDLVTPEGQKVAGLLAELELSSEPFGEGGQIRWIVLGVGVNVNQLDFSADLPDATSLARLRGAPQDRAALLARLVAAIEGVDCTAADPLAGWRSRSHTLGRRVQVGEVQGLASAIRADGALIVGGQPVLTGDVALLVD